MKRPAPPKSERTASRAASREYFKALGAHVAQLRKALGMTQAELARAIGVSQQAVFAYELGDRRISVLILSKLSRVFNVPVEELIGMTKPARAPKGRLSPRAMRHAARLQSLSKTKQRFVVRIIDVLEADSTGSPAVSGGNELPTFCCCRFCLKPRPSLRAAVTAGGTAARMRVGAVS